MALISPEYMELQKKLHDTGNYGKGVDAYECAAIIRAIAEPGSTILDYGCGQGHFGKVLGDGFTLREYDPCIEGKDGPPEAADYVVCADVLEHIEPDNLKHVLHHIRTLAQKEIILVIATQASKKLLEDGRNAHLIVEGVDWWKKTLEPYMKIERLEDRTDQGKGLLVMGQGIKELPTIKAIGVLSDEERNKHTETNIGLTWKRIPPQPCLPNNKLLIVACYGPSIGDTWEVIKKQKEAAAPGLVEVVSVSGAHDFLRAKGIKPDYHVECDPRLHKSEMIARPRKGIRYLMASCCHPDLMRRLAEYDLTLWHLFNGEESYKIREHPSEKDAALIPGGGSVALRALVLFYYLGYRAFVMHGFDCSYAEDGKTHAGPHSQKKIPPPITIGVAGTEKWFKTSPVMITYAQHMLADINSGRYPGCQFWFMGDGLFQTMLQQHLKAPPAERPPGFGKDYFNLTPEDIHDIETWHDPPKEVAA